ncbi:flagellar hook protein : Flagellar hook-associated 2 domain protein OS=Methylovorus glucosetrophus (strain SIP3-4) GN=Msip34_0750 PE=4 SV=1: FliD_N: FliD_C [Gemmata massiliana]|uniref:Flagellar hook-associated protein 2 n=1 Tax=Gemmata massiliana TaxID=1210884 RepID=A0A6P2DA49_9BACT|nr:flagellar filament capping protein FliD [Gemmata massiliana]VTR96402.1 flagellar hook protein : Flagellar hook-associated 2 domain protein OS=Methylovorus glucosetrophus (strain SIP3-4) GN=Msip34_0750 PE=4 SV=1: FliD_N: FliD_C [Gemmata massiliana]
MAISSVNSNGLNFSGLATGIDTAKIIDGLNSISQQRIDRFKVQKTEVISKQATFATLQGKLYDLQSKTNALARSGGGAFDGRTATSSDSTAVSAVAGTAAVAGTYSLSVVSLAKAAQVSSAGFSDPNAQIKEGTLTLQVGSGTATTVTVDSRNNTLQGLADSINTAGGDLRASVVNDGTGGTPYRLLLTSAKTGAANAITVTNNLSTGTGAAIDPGATVVQAATDAQVKVGSGAGAITVTSATNQVNNLITGVSLNVLQADATKTISVTVKADTSATVQAVQDFVTSYNAVRDFITEQTKFDADSSTAGALLGNGDVSALTNELSSALAATIPGLSTSSNRLSTVGLAFDDDGKLTFDSDKFTSALNTSDTAQADFKRLFSLSGKSDATGVDFLVGTNKTKATAGTPYQVNITAPAKRAVLIGSNPPVILSGSAPTTLQVKLNSLASIGVTIPGGPYASTDDLLAAVQKAINSAPSLNGNLVTASVNGDGKVQITTQKYGSAANVAITGGSSDLLTALGFNGTETATGTDVAGNFVVNGVTEAATGSGQILSGSPGNANTDGLQVTSTLSAPGSANVTVTQGLASRLGAVLNKYLDPVNGRFKQINDVFTKQTSDIDANVAKQQALVDAKTAQLQSQFAAMETAVNNLKGIQTQLSSLTASASSSSS